MTFDGSTFDPDLGARRLGTQLELVRDYIVGYGSWLSLHELEQATATPQASISARLRDLRKAKFGGYLVERCRRADVVGTWEYKVTEPQPQGLQQGSLFEEGG